MSPTTGFHYVGWADGGGFCTCLPARVLNERLAGQKTLALSALRSLGPEETDYDGLRAAFTRVAGALSGRT